MKNNWFKFSIRPANPLLVIFGFIVMIFAISLLYKHQKKTTSVNKYPIQAPIKEMEPSEMKIIIQKTSKIKTSINLEVVAGLFVGISHINSAYMLIGTHGDTAYCDTRYTFLPLMGDEVRVRKMYGMVKNDTASHDIWMQISNIKPEHNATGFHGF